MKIIIDYRMREVEKNYLKKYGELIELKYQDSVYEEISSHPDIFICNINGTIIKAQNLKLDDIDDIGSLGDSCIKEKYPDDIRYNVCNIGKYVVHNFEYTDKRILKEIEEKHLIKINVKQGYSNCSIAVVNDNACITTDKEIYDSLKKNNIDVLYIKENNIKLLDKDGNESKMKGFIGGASSVINNKFILFGDSRHLENREELIKFLEKHKLELVEFKNNNIYDYGGIVII